MPRRRRPNAPNGSQLINSLPGRECIAGLFLIVDIRRGIDEHDEQLVEWAGPPAGRSMSLLAKADKLNQRERAATLKDAEASLPEGMTAQVFSAHGQDRRRGGPEDA